MAASGPSCSNQGPFPVFQTLYSCSWKFNDVHGLPVVLMGPKRIRNTRVVATRFQYPSGRQ